MRRMELSRKRFQQAERQGALPMSLAVPHHGLPMTAAFQAPTRDRRLPLRGLAQEVESKCRLRAVARHRGRHPEQPRGQASRRPSREVEVLEAAGECLEWVGCLE